MMQGIATYVLGAVDDSLLGESQSVLCSNGEKQHKD